MSMADITAISSLKLTQASVSICTKFVTWVWTVTVVRSSNVDTCLAVFTFISFFYTFIDIWNVVYIWLKEGTSAVQRYNTCKTI